MSSSSSPEKTPPSEIASGTTRVKYASRIKKAGPSSVVIFIQPEDTCFDFETTTV